MDERGLVARGLASGALGGLVAFAFARVFAEPVIQRAIDYESGRDAAAHTARGPDLFSRGVQANIGAGIGLVLFGLAMGGLAAVAYALAARRTDLAPRRLALLVAGLGCLALYLLPFLKYPANPPSIGDPDTIRERGFLYLAMVAISAAAVIGAVLAARRAAWLAAAAVVGVAIAALPGVHETPGPLRDASGAIVYPGFPADTLFQFRLYSVLAQLILWGTLGLAFGALLERERRALRWGPRTWTSRATK
jgi:hypothetical protein